LKVLDRIKVIDLNVLNRI